MTGTCGCGKALGPRNRSGLCRPCLARRHNADPEMAKRRGDGMRRALADPVVKAGYLARLAAAGKRPDVIEKRRAHGRRRAAVLQAAIRDLTPEQRAENGRKRSATVLAWCPAELHDEYRALTRGGMRAAEAKAMILDQAAAVERRRLAAMTPFERQLDRVRKGAAVTERVAMPSRDYGTLGGIASGLL